MSNTRHSNKRYFWLKLKTDFFNQKAIKKLRKIAGGDTYTIIYLKMQLWSIQNDAKIIYDGIEDNIAEQLSLELDEDVDNIQVTIIFLEKNHLIEKLDSDNFLLPEALSAVGSETQSTVRSRVSRQKKALEVAGQKSNTALQCNGKATTKQQSSIKNATAEKEIEKEIDNNMLIHVSDNYENETGNTKSQYNYSGTKEEKYCLKYISSKKEKNQPTYVYFDIQEKEIKKISQENKVEPTSFWHTLTELNHHKLFSCKHELIQTAIQLTQRQECGDGTIDVPFHYAKVYEIVELERMEQLSTLQHLFLSAMLDEVLKCRDIYKPEAYEWAEFQLSSPDYHFVGKDFRHSCNIIKKQLFKDGKQSYSKPIGFKRFSVVRDVK